MTRMSRIALTLTLGASLALVVGAARAQPNGDPDDLGRLRPRRLARLLDLDAEQIARSRELFRQALDETRPVREHMRQLRGELRSQLETPTADDAAIGKMARQLHGLRAQLGDSREKFLEGFEGLLTPVQKERFESLRDLRRRLRDVRQDRADGIRRGP